MIRINKITFTIVILLFSGYGCNNKITNENLPTLPSSLEPVVSSTVEPIPINTITLPATLIPTNKPEPTSIPKPTIIPTLPIKEQEDIVYDFFMNNGNCQLPCWWGITPGKTSWEEARQILAPLILGDEYLSYGDNNQMIASYTVPIDDRLDSAIKQVNFSYLFENSIVQSIRFYNYDLSPILKYETFIAQMGEPDEIWVYTERGDEGKNVIAHVGFFYSQTGGVAEYSFPAKVVGDIIRICMNYGDGFYPFVVLWNSDLGWSYEDVDTPWDLLPYDKVPMEEITSTDTTILYQKIINNQGDACIETSVDLWYPYYSNGP